MANSDTPFGLKLLDYNPRLLIRGVIRAAASLTYNLGINDPVIFEGTSDATGKWPAFTEITVGDGNYITGVISSFEPDPAGGLDSSNNYAASGTRTRDRYCSVCIDPDARYLIQDDGAAALTAAAVGSNANLIRTHNTDTSNGISGMELDTNSDEPDADASNNLIIHQLYPVENNDLGVHAKWVVSISAASFRPCGALGV